MAFRSTGIGFAGLGAIAAVLPLAGCSALKQPPAPVVQGKSSFFMSERQKAEYNGALQTIKANEGVAYVCSNGQSVLALYAVNGGNEVVAARVNVGNVISPPLLAKRTRDRVLFTFLDGEFVWEVELPKGKPLSDSKKGELTLTRNGAAKVFSDCAPHKEMSAKFNRQIAAETDLTPAAKGAAGGK